MRFIIATLVSVVLPPFVSAHYSTFSTFDGEVTDELVGEITQVIWRNPHVRFTIRAGGSEGQEELWQIETHSVSGRRQQNI